MNKPILDGVRIFDLSIVTAGAGCTQVLADFGAEVIKVESAGKPDLFRGWWNPTTGEGDLDGSGFRTINRNKQAVGVDLKHPDGLAVAKQLIAECDVVVENFRQGVLPRLGLGFDDLVEINPRIVLVSVASQGTTGPDALYGSFGCPLDALGGFMSVTGYDESNPLWSSMQVNYPDQTASIVGPGLIALGILAARASGEPRWIDISQREIATALLPEAVLNSSLGAPDPLPQRNRGYDTLEWATACAGEDNWLTVSITEVSDRARLAGVVGVQTDATDDALISATARWSRTRARVDAAVELQAHGIAAAPVMRGYELHEDPYFKAVGYFRPVPREGHAPEPQRGFVVRFDEDDAAGKITRRAPHIGEHTRQILTDLLGYAEDKIERLRDSGAISYPAQLDEPARA